MLTTADESTSSSRVAQATPGTQPRTVTIPFGEAQSSPAPRLGIPWRYFTHRTGNREVMSSPQGSPLKNLKTLA